jgi:hypothetical protein
MIASPASARREISSTLYHRLFPNTRISNAKDTELEFATTLGGNRLATSVGGTLTGRGGNLIIIDDPLKPLDAYSQAARENIIKTGTKQALRINFASIGAQHWRRPYEHD